MAPQQLRIGFDGDAAGWLVSGAEPGPAGRVSPTLSGLRVTVDAVHTERLVEIVVFAASEDAPLSRAVLDAFGGLLGRECAQTLASRPAGGTNVNGTPTGSVGTARKSRHGRVPLRSRPAGARAGCAASGRGQACAGRDRRRETAPKSRLGGASRCDRGLRGQRPIIPNWSTTWQKTTSASSPPRSSR